MTSLRCDVAFAGIFSLLVISSVLAEADNAVAEFGAIREKLRAARINHDWSASLEAASSLCQLLNGSPDGLFELARAKVHSNDSAGAIGDLNRFIQMGQSTELTTTSPEFAPLRQQSDFAALQAGMKENQKPVSIATTVFRLLDPDLLPEDLDYDPNSQRLYLTSVRQKKIVSANLAGSVNEFAKAPDGWPMLAIKVDAQRDVLWATEVALQGFVFVPEADWGRSAVLCYQLKDGKLLRRIEGPHGSALGDMVLAPDGDVIVSDGEGGGVYRVKPDSNTLERLDGGDFISPQTPTMHPNGGYVLVPDYLRGIGLLDLATKEVRWLDTQGKFALNGIDGMYLRGKSLLAVQNGTSPERVVAFELDPSLTKIVSETVIERSTATLGDPTHGVIIGNDFYYIANSGWDIIDDHGNLKPGAQPSAACIMRVKDVSNR